MKKLKIQFKRQEYPITKMCSQGDKNTILRNSPLEYLLIIGPKLSDIRGPLHLVPLFP